MCNRLVSMLKTTAIITLISVSMSFCRDVMAWVSACDLDDARNSLQERWGEKDGITILGLQWWLPNKSGGLMYSKDWDPNDTTIDHPSDTTVRWFKKFASSQGMKAYMCLFNCEEKIWDWSLSVSAIKTYPTQTINAIDQVLTNLELDGVDIDLESATAGQNQTEWTSFVKALYDKVNPKGKKVSVCTFASDNGGSPGVSWPTGLGGKYDHIMCMGYQWAGAGTSISYSSLYSAAGSPGGKFCMGVNFDDSTGLAGYWGSGTAQSHIQEIYGMSSIGLCIWTAALKGQWDGGQGEALAKPAIWTEIKKFANKTFPIDTANPSPNLLSIAQFTDTAGGTGSTSTMTISGGVLAATLKQGGSVDDGSYANVTGICGNDFTGVKCIKVTYTADKPITIQLYQKDLNESGECFQNFIPVATSYSTVVLNVSTFYQPWWGKKTDNLDLSKVNGIIIDPILIEQAGGTTKINIKEIYCYGRTSPWTTPIVQTNKPIAFNPQFEISAQADNLSYTVPAVGNYSIEIFKPNGSLVKTFATGKVQRGTHKIEHAVKGLAKGMYNVRLSGEAGVKTSAIVVR